MPNLTDLIIFFTFLAYALIGWQKGALKSILGPASFILCFILAWQYFQLTHKVLISLSISLLGPLFINIFGSWILSLNDHVEGVPQREMSSASRFIGLTVNLLWAGVVLALFMAFFGIGLVRVGPVLAVREDVLRSCTYAAMAPRLRPFLPVELPAGDDDETVQAGGTAEAGTVPAVDQRLTRHPEFQALLNDPRIKDLTTDPQVARLIEERDYGRLVQNEKFARILDDPQLILRLLQVQGKINAMPKQ